MADSCTCLSISRDPLCAWHGDLDKVKSAEVDRLKLQLAAAEERIKKLEGDLLGICDHKFIDSDCCLKCGWKPAK